MPVSRIRHLPGLPFCGVYSGLQMEDCAKVAKIREVTKMEHNPSAKEKFACAACGTDFGRETAVAECECATGLIVTNAWTKRDFVWLVERRARMTAGGIEAVLGIRRSFWRSRQGRKAHQQYEAGFSTRLHSPQPGSWEEHFVEGVSPVLRNLIEQRNSSLPVTGVLIIKEIGADLNHGHPWDESKFSLWHRYREGCQEFSCSCSTRQPFDTEEFLSKARM